MEQTKAYTITDACIGCTICKKNCPVGAIAGELKQKHTIDPDRCIACGLCGKLCAKAAILDSEGKPTKREAKSAWLHPVIDKTDCAGCSVCVEVCPTKALAITAPKHAGDIHTVAALSDADKCIGCGICAQTCPIGAINMQTKDSMVPAAPEKRPFSLYTLYCRTFQAVMIIGQYFMGYRMPKYFDGPGSIKKLAPFLIEKGAKKILVVTDNRLLELGLPNGMLEAMQAAGIPYTVFSDIQPNPTSDDVEAGVKLYKENGCDALVAFGGGAPMDCAKAIGARIARPRKSVAQLQGILRVLKRVPLFIAVPTTSGTGSETTLAAVITDAATHRKASINDPSILPKYAVLDPELTMGLPPFVTATTGMDALCHAVEAYTNHWYNTKEEDRLAIEAVRLIHENLLVAYRDGSNLEARQNMQKAALFAGRAFTRGCVGYVHAVGHTLGGLYGVPHGLAMSILLPHVMRQFGAKVYPRLAVLADACGIEGATEAEKALKFIAWIEQLKADMNIPVGLDMVKDEDIPQMIRWAMKEANPLYPVPVVWFKKDFERLLDTVRV